MTTRSLRIIHTVSSLQGGGMEQFVLRLAESQIKAGHSASIVSLNDGPLLEIAAQKQLPVTVINHGPMLARIAHCALHFAVQAPDIVHCHNPTSLRYATIGKLVSGGRLLFTDHAQTKGIVRKGSPFEWRRVNAYVAVSGETATHAGDIGYHGATEVVHNGVEFAPAQRPREAVRTALGLPVNRIVVVNVASFYPVKAQDVLIKAAAKLKADGQPVTTVFLGDGAERTKTEQLAESLGLGPDDVRFLGFRNDVPDILAASDIFVLPSRAEGLPMSILEAMSHRLPVVCTPVGGNPELVLDGEHGKLTPVDDASALANAIGQLASDPVLRQRQGEAGYKRVTHDFSFDLTSQRYEAIYRRILKD
ncbi:MAG: glycosyltransferase family 4 protein [Aquabacterium sp.]|nr:glycosyltransferase family 4 protein [Aquabacterium sp.]